MCGVHDEKSCVSMEGKWDICGERGYAARCSRYMLYLSDNNTHFPAAFLGSPCVCSREHNMFCTHPFQHVRRTRTFISQTQCDRSTRTAAYLCIFSALHSVGFNQPADTGLPVNIKATATGTPGTGGTAAHTFTHIVRTVVTCSPNQHPKPHPVGICSGVDGAHFPYRFAVERRRQFAA